MLAFVPPPGGAPRRELPDRPHGTALGVVLALILFVVGLTLPWVRPAVREAAQTRTMVDGR